MMRHSLCSPSTKILDDKVLQTVLCKAEAILDDRPISKLSNDPDELEALTPNHILLMRGNPALPSGLFERSLRQKEMEISGIYFQSLLEKMGTRIPTLVAKMTKAEQRT